MAYSKEKQQTLITSLTNIGALVGTNNTGVANGIKGLEMSFEQSKCKEVAKTVRDGLFKVAVMGTFASGKSTVINALVGSKVVPESSLPYTAIPTFIQYGTKEDCVNVYMAEEIQKDGSIKTGECRQMNVRDFQEEYKYTIQDQEEFNATGTVERFDKVKYAVKFCSKPLMEFGVSIVDVRGFGDKKDIELAMKIAQEAQAIIYVVTDRGFASYDKDFIYSTFRNCPTNVFFLLNKFDLIEKESRPAVLNKLKLDLLPVFTDKNGTFDEKLYEKRVFGISALRALDSRRGITYDIGEEKPLSAEECEKLYEKSWFGPFENELEIFLTTDEKCVAQYKKCFSQMATTYRNAQAQISEYINVYENEILMDETQKAEYAKIMDEIRKGIEITEKIFDNCSLKIQYIIAEVLNSYAGVIKHSWEQYMEKLAKKVDVSTFDYMLNSLKYVNPLASKESRQQVIEKFAGKFLTAVSEYFAEKIEEYIKDNSFVVEEKVSDLARMFNDHLSLIKTLFENSPTKITTEKIAQIAQMNECDKYWLDSLISDYYWTHSIIPEAAFDDNPYWLESIKREIFNTVWQNVLEFLVDGREFLITMYNVGVWGDREKFFKYFPSKTKDNIIKTIPLHISEACDNINKQIALEIDKKKKEKRKEMTQKLLDEQKKMDIINLAHSDHDFNLDTEKDRFNTILSAIYNEAKEAYSAVFGKELTMPLFETF